MNFEQAIRSVLRQYVGFSGRAVRSEYWWFFLFNVGVSIVASALDRSIGTPVLSILLTLALLLPGIAVTLRRLHDSGRSGWWIWISLIPLVGTIVLIVFLCRPSNPGANRYGDAPQAPTGR